MQRLGPIVFFLLFWILPAQATTSTKELSENPYWHTLIHYHKTWFGNNRSSVRSEDFFLSKNGATNPQEELEATIEAMQMAPGSNTELHAQCRFPARLLWLRKIAPQALTKIPDVTCEGFQKFSYQHNIESVSLLFATGYLSNPASFFGHPLIKFNLPRSKMPSSLLDVSANYGAITPPNENGFVYAFKGLFGGYNATYSHRQFYYNNHAYGETELRDMWEYQLNLKPDEVDEVVAHTWELTGKFFPYRFLSDNCASAMGEMISNITGVQLMPQHLPYALPITLFDNLAHKKRADGSSLVTSVVLIPSRQTRLTTRYKTLNKSEKAVVHAVAQTDTVGPVQKIPDDAGRIKVIETLFDYYSFRNVGNSNHEAYSSIKRALLLERLKLPSSSDTQNLEQENLFPPHQAQRPFLTRISALKSQSFGDGFELHIRPAYYDFLALDYGRPKNSSVGVFDISAYFYRDKIWLQKWDLVSIETLNLSQTGLPGDGGYAWDFRTGLENVNLACEHCLAFKIEGGVGKAWEFFDRQVFFVMLDAMAQTPAAGSGSIAGTPRLGLLFDFLPSGAWKSNISYGYRDFADDSASGEQMFRWEHRFGLSQNWDIRAAYEKHVAELWKLSYSRYW